MKLKVGDLIVVREDDVAAGWAIIQSIDVKHVTHETERCPSCKRSRPRKRKNLHPEYVCESCGLEFTETELYVTIDPVTEFQANYIDTWNESDRVVHFKEIEQYQIGNGRMNSMRQLDMSRIQGLIDKMTGPAFDYKALFSPQDMELIVGGHQVVTTRRRRGQRQFRFAMLDRYGETCAVSGTQPPQVLEAAHLYSFAKIATHRSDGGLLLRRDYHALFDKHFITINPSTWQIIADPYLKQFDNYSKLNGSDIQISDNLRPDISLIEEHCELTLGVMASRR